MRFQKLLLLFAFLSFSICSFGQGTQVEFGKNRVQYHDDFDDWLMYESYNFITYWYGKGRNIGQSVVMMAEKDFNEVQNILEHHMNDKIEIIVYTDVTDLKQSNIGSEDAFINTGGQTKIVGNKIFVHFDGNHNNLRKQIREGIASVYMNAMLFGSNLQEIVQNAVMMNLPAWFKDGLIAYVGEDWNTDIDNQLRDVFQNEKIEDFNDLAEKNPTLAGHSLWYYISQNFGKSTVSNLLYLTRINRSVESGFLYVLGSSYDRTLESWFNYFRQRYAAEVKDMATVEGTPLPVKNKRHLPLSELKISPDGKQIAYVSNEIGKYKVYLQDVNTGKKKVIFKGGFKNAFQATDYGYPLLAWNPNNQELGILFEKRDVAKLMFYDVTTNSSTTDDLNPQYDRVFSMEYVSVAKMVFSAQVAGHSDIFTYFTKTRQTQRITNDFWDDLHAKPVNIHGKQGIIFSSNRMENMMIKEKLDSILPLQTYDLFFYELDNKSSELVRITNTPLANEFNAIQVDSTWFSYLSDESGVYNRRSGYLEDYIAYYEDVITLKDDTEIVLHQDSTLSSLDSTLIKTVVQRPVMKIRALTHNNTNYNRSIIEQSAAPRVNKLVESIFTNGKHQFFVREMNPKQTVEARTSRFIRQKLKVQESINEPPESFSSIGNENVIRILEEVDQKPIDIVDIPSEKQDTGKIDIDNYMFQSEFDDDETPAEVVQEEDSEIRLQRTPTEIPPIVSDDVNPVVKFRPARIVPYRLKFRTDHVTTQLDNSLLFGGLDSYAGDKQEYSYPAPGILLKANFKDLFEDYQVEGGVRLPTTFNGAEFFVLFDHKKNRLDKRFAAYRRSLRNVQDENIITIPSRRIQETTFISYFEARYPLDIFRSIRGSATLRLDNRIQLSTDAFTVNTPVDPDQRLGLKVEYVFDNTMDVALNIKHGTRYKIFAELVKRFDVELVDNFKIDLSEGFMTVLGIDARHYQRLDKHSILAARFAASTTLGSEKILYIMGGVDGWLFPGFNNEIPFPQDDAFAYQTLASNMRGFKNNIRNGSSYALANVELRVPIIKYFSNRIRSSFFRNLQLIGFFDVGTAWQGPTPFADENPLNTIFISNPQSPVSVKVNYFRDPVVAGYGAGIRSVLFGYFVRLDYAWGIETRVVQDPRIYFSLGMDF